MKDNKVYNIVQRDCTNQTPIKERGFVMVEEIESHLHYMHKRTLIEFLIQKIRHRYLLNSQFNVSIFVASGRVIDKKIDNLNRRIHKKQQGDYQ